MQFLFLIGRFLKKSCPLKLLKDFKKSANQKQELPVAAMFVTGSGQNVQSLERTAHRCFLPSFGSFGQAVSEEKIFKETRIACGDRNMVGSIYGQSSLKIAHFVPIQ
jgi:hypothetical protein